jgi:hypothetical protein
MKRKIAEGGFPQETSPVSSRFHSLLSAPPTLPFGGEDIKAGTKLFRGVQGRSPTCQIIPNRHLWLSRELETANVYAKPYTCSYEVVKPFTTVPLSPANLKFLHQEWKSQPRKNEMLDDLAFAFGYDPRTESLLSCAELPERARRIRTKIDPTLLPIQSTVPSGRCSFTDVDNKILNEFCSYLDQHLPWIAGYASPKTPTARGDFHEEMVLCHPQRYLGSVIAVELLITDPSQESQDKVDSPTYLRVKPNMKIKHLFGQWASRFPAFVQEQKQKGAEPLMIADGQVMSFDSPASVLLPKRRIVIFFRKLPLEIPLS